MADKTAMDMFADMAKQINLPKIDYEAFLDIHRKILFGQVFDVSQRGFYDEIFPEVFIDGLRLCWRLHDYQSFWHRKLSKCGALRR